ncbi:MAG: hypothetical protein KJ709_00785 [Nanoarchaeota archaeon]|nr:hypothetical protein [Nanoarchaeota archaeon]
MITEGLKKEIRKHAWWHEEFPSVVQTIIHPLQCFITMSRDFHPKLMSIVILVMKDRNVFEITPEDEKYQLYDFFYEKMQKDKDYLKKAVGMTRQRAKKLFSEFNRFDKQKERYDKRMIWKSYSRFMELYVDYLSFPAAIECTDAFTTNRFEAIVRKELPELSDEQLAELIFTMSAPKMLSFMEAERLALLGFCLKHYDNIKSNKPTAQMKTWLEQHSKNYYYVLSNYKDIRFLDDKHFWKASKKEIKKSKDKIEAEHKMLKGKVSSLKRRKKSMLNKYSFSDDLKLHFTILETMGEAMDERKDNMVRANNCIETYGKEIANRSGLDIWDVKDYTYDEIKQLLLAGKEANRELLGKRREISTYVVTRKDGKAHFDMHYGQEAKEIFEATLSDKTSEVKGQVASAHVKTIRARVQIIKDVSKQRFKQGNILVATMTRPEFLPLMRKAAAIITDEGGITCHAAIISRELGIPCIIGTRNATKVLKDGALVEIDTEKGIVKKVVI